MPTCLAIAEPQDGFWLSNLEEGVEDKLRPWNGLRGVQQIARVPQLGVIDPVGQGEGESEGEEGADDPDPDAGGEGAS